jgi:hypothetical protein
MALVDSNSFYVEGYFEETKLPRIREGDRVTVMLMGEPRRILGHVDSIAMGIADRDRSIGANLLPNVNPNFNWVRLAQRIPVRVHIDQVPGGVRLVAGQTATVAVLDGPLAAATPATATATPATSTDTSPTSTATPLASPATPPISAATPAVAAAKPMAAAATPAVAAAQAPRARGEHAREQRS